MPLSMIYLDVLHESSGVRVCFKAGCNASIGSESAKGVLSHPCVFSVKSATSSFGLGTRRRVNA